MSRVQHLRTESQACVELEQAFKSVDLEGDGKLDMASFQTAMCSLDVMVEFEKIEELFNSVDTAKKGYIRYEDFLKLLKRGRLTPAAQKVMESAKSIPSSRPPSSTVEMRQSAALPVKRKMNSKMKTTIHRAVIVIKKAAMKNISREEVVEFLKDKGMKDDDINYAYEKAQEKAMSSEESIRYLKTQISAKDKQLFDQRALTRHLSDQVQMHNSQVDILKSACLKSVDQLLERKPMEEAKSSPPEDVLLEVRRRITKLRSSREDMDDKKAKLLSKNLVMMEKLEACLKTNRTFCAYLLLLSVEPVMLSTLQKTQAFLSEWDK